MYEFTFFYTKKEKKIINFSQNIANIGIVVIMKV